EDDAALLVPLVLLLVLFLSSLPHAASHSASPPAPAMPAPLSSCRRASRVRPTFLIVAAMSSPLPRVLRADRRGRRRPISGSLPGGRRALLRGRTTVGPRRTTSLPQDVRRVHHFT